jgi:hypothetical protein
MAKLTAQQKRDREFMALLDSKLAEQEIALKIQAEREKYDSYMKGFTVGWTKSQESFEQLPLLKRVNFTSKGLKWGGRK